MSITVSSVDGPAIVIPVQLPDSGRMPLQRPQRRDAPDVVGPLTLVSEEPGDAELITTVRAGRLTAYGVLYQRHRDAAYNLAGHLTCCAIEADDLVSEAFVKVLDTLLGQRGPDSAFRAYLLTTLRHIAYDKTRRARKVELTDDIETTVADTGRMSEPFPDTVVARVERGMVAQAFARLPERWQQVLWYAEIQELMPSEVGSLMGLSSSAASALAYRARKGLRQAYLQVHVVEPKDRTEDCRLASARFGAWTRGGLSKR